MNNGQLLEAYQELSACHEENPEDTMSGLLLALAKWKMMWLSTYNSEDREFLTSLLDQIVDECKDREEEEPDCLFYTAGASAIRTQLLTTENQWWDAAQESKKMKRDAERLIEVDPEYYDDDYLLGSFNYFADVLPGYIKFLRRLMFLPSGDRTLGMRQLIMAYQKAPLASGEAGRTLALIYTYFEKRSDYGLQMCDTMLRTYPDNYEIGLYKGINLYFLARFQEAESWLHELQTRIHRYSRKHGATEAEPVVQVYAPMEREVRYWIARCLIQQKKNDEAKEILMALAVPEIHQPYWLQRGVQLSLAQLDYKQGNNAEAEKRLSKVLRWPDLKDAHEKAGNLRKKKNKIGRFDIDFL